LKTSARNEGTERRKAERSKGTWRTPRAEARKERQAAHRMPESRRREETAVLRNCLAPSGEGRRGRPWPQRTAVDVRERAGATGERVGSAGAGSRTIHQGTMSEHEFYEPHGNIRRRVVAGARSLHLRNSVYTR
ncbi:unnamed protein product, partial [Phaeothamnion confervicola]